MSDNGEVLVVATRQADAIRLCDILCLAGYRPHWCPDFSCSERLQSNGKLATSIVAIVLCHRVQAQPTGTGPSGINLPSELPNQLRCRRIIAVSDCTAEQTVVSLLDDGAHHCFNLLESSSVLQVRLEAALRHHGRPINDILTSGNISFDLLKRRVTHSGFVVDLSPKEYELAYYLFSNRDRLVENGELLTSIWSLPAGMETRRIDTAACRVRKKLKLTAEHGWELKRQRRLGYRLVRTH
ncbi:Sensory transduction protein regX3 [Granulosicoccus antarcticus IMCC3135]|uniref:Sensory transduction protein regX3 n=2 Tax=Granulosicoccus TaxID=437504 RepID=A0A2Z2NRC7_9GAMM|nr:Sensory transduction protein regX3 [Granulosicoccus antarcticus IMCC3135]